jgi:transposase-like protein
MRPKVLCPKCQKRMMHINYTMNSFPNYVCASYGWENDCGFVISVDEYNKLTAGKGTKK